MLELLLELVRVGTAIMWAGCCHAGIGGCVLRSLIARSWIGLDWIEEVR